MRRDDERGFALAIAIIVAVLYFALIELLMIDSSRDLSQARLFRARVIAQTLAENAAELAALNMADPTVGLTNAQEQDWQGKMVGSMQKTIGEVEGTGETPQQVFTIKASGEAGGVARARAAVEVRGRIRGRQILIDYTKHSD